MKYIWLAVVVVAGVGWWWMSKPAVAPSAPENNTVEINPEAGLPGGEIGTNVVYRESGFEPKAVTVKTGGAVKFRNESGRSFWPASDVHPTHGAYPEGGGCIGSAFDACRGIASGEEWSFIFNKTGEWTYHDHLNAQYTGVIVVVK